MNLVSINILISISVVILISSCDPANSCPSTSLVHKGHIISFPISAKDAIYSYDLKFKRRALLADTALAQSRKIVAYYRKGYDDNRYTMNENQKKDELLEKGIYGISFLDWSTNDTKMIATQLKDLYKKPIVINKTQFQKITYYKVKINECVSIIVFGFQPINTSFFYLLNDQEMDRFVESNGSIILD
ncbi:hypothetical protein P1X15_17725 [Runella sp. MFBS21]|uniref:hypothetical protein n=1 Tax=Runella sp. MFBS21 TaxID=3034018 RepID=UPI0023F977CD|nr:hypothetical protein [Runella sp. MFBS21]MDF7819462.1 hypothetical protein [Runella sp. MFBS21]